LEKKGKEKRRTRKTQTLHETVKNDGRKGRAIRNQKGQTTRGKKEFINGSREGNERRTEKKREDCFLLVKGKRSDGEDLNLKAEPRGNKGENKKKKFSPFVKNLSEKKKKE